MKYLITGGAGYIGSTIASALLDAGHTPIILDNLAVGRREFVRERIFYEGDIADHQPAAGFEVAAQHAEQGDFAGLIEVVKHIRRNDARVTLRHIGGQGSAQLVLKEVRLRHFAAGDLQHFGGKIAAPHPAAGLRETHRQVAGAAAEVEHAHARTGKGALKDPFQHGGIAFEGKALRSGNFRVVIRCPAVKLFGRE